MTIKTPISFFLVIKRSTPYIILVLLYAAGLIGHITECPGGEYCPILHTLTPFALLFSGFIVLYISQRKYNLPLLMWWVITFLLTLIIEILGVKTGFIFGTYSYSEMLGTKLLGVPLIIGFNWVLVLFGIVNLVRIHFDRPVPVAFISGIIAVLFDIIIEPVATRLGYWEWSGGAVPIQNYIAWFLISFIAVIGYFRLKISARFRLPVVVFLLQLIFFIVLYLVWM